MDMILCWVKDRVEQDQLNVGWAPGDTNMGDYFTKNSSPAHHTSMISYYLYDKQSPMIKHGTRLAILQGCVDIYPSSHPDRALSALSYGLKANCNLSQSHYGHIDKLLPLPHPPVRARTNARTNPSAQRATQLRSVLARVYAVSIQNQITNNVP
jgi:hypothetical protein